MSFASRESTVVIEFRFGVGRTRDGREILLADRQRGLARIKSHVLALYGGYSLAFVEGGWNDQGDIVEEPGAVLTIIAPCFDWRDVAAVADAISRELEQQEVWVTNYTASLRKHVNPAFANEHR